MALMSFDILLNLSLSYHTRRRTGELLRILSRSEAINDVRNDLALRIRVDRRAQTDATARAVL